MTEITITITALTQGGYKAVVCRGSDGSVVELYADYIPRLMLRVKRCVEGLVE